MKTVITMILLLIAGQTTAGEQLIDVQHDSVRGVTCWILNNTGISCLPDGSFQGHPTATPSSEVGRDSHADSGPKKGLQVAAPLPRETSESSTCAKSQVSASAGGSYEKGFQL